MKLATILIIFLFQYFEKYYMEHAQIKENNYKTAQHDIYH